MFEQLMERAARSARQKDDDTDREVIAAAQARQRVRAAERAACSDDRGDTSDTSDTNEALRRELLAGDA